MLRLRSRMEPGGHSLASSSHRLRNPLLCPICMDLDQVTSKTPELVGKLLQPPDQTAARSLGNVGIASTVNGALAASRPS